MTKHRYIQTLLVILLWLFAMLAGAGGQRLQEHGWCMIGAPMYIHTLLAVLLWPFAMCAGAGGLRLQKYVVAGA
jgi:hypothetical protein